MARNDHRKGKLPFKFIAIPRLILDSHEWHKLPPNAIKLALDLAAQYTGKNNGRLTPAWEAMQRRGWVSKGTLNRAKSALLEASFVVLTRKGHAPSTAEWIGLTWWKLDHHLSMDIGPKGLPYLNFAPVQLARIDPNVGRCASNSKHLERSRNETDTPQKAGQGGPKMRPMNGAIHSPSVSKQDHGP